MFFFPHDRIRQVWSQSNLFCFASVLFLVLFSNPDFFGSYFCFANAEILFQHSGVAFTLQVVGVVCMASHSGWTSPTFAPGAARDPGPNQKTLLDRPKGGEQFPSPHSCLTPGPFKYEDFWCPVSFSMWKKRCYIHKCQISHKLHSLGQFSNSIGFSTDFFEENSYPESIRWAPRWSEIQRKWSTQNAGILLKGLDMLGLRSSYW